MARGFLPISRPWTSNLTKLAGQQKHWHSDAPRACVQNPGINLRSIMCLLDDVVLGVQASGYELLEETVAHPFLVDLAHEIITT